jgi:magnesium chelatase accessory protein
VHARWAQDSRNWPHAAHSRFVRAAGLEWHVQEFGAGPVVLLLHGTGAANHSWRGLAPLLARRFRVLAPDLPGHGYTDVPPRAELSLAGMSAALGALLDTLQLRPALLVGHSAGAALAVRMTLDRRVRPAAIVSLNGAMLPLTGALGLAFAGTAKLLSMAPLVSRVMAWQVTRPGAVERLLRDTGSTLDPEGLALYARLASDPDHVAAVFDMMANWNLGPLARELSRLECPLLLLAAACDGMVPPGAAERLARLAPHATRVELPGLGHLAHEEDPALIARHIDEFTRREEFTREVAADAA